MFQTKLRVDAGGAEVFLPVRDVLEQDWPEHDDEVRRLDLQYRNRLEFAIGRTCSVGLGRSARVRGGRPRCRRPGCRSARRRRPRARSVERRAAVDGRAVDGDARRAAGRARAAGDGLRRMARRAGGAAAERCRRTCGRPPRRCCGRPGRPTQRLVDGLEHVATDAEALRCFRFMNRVMRDQRIASQVAAAAGIRPVGHDRAGAGRGRGEGRRRRRRGARSSWRSS